VRKAGRVAATVLLFRLEDALGKNIFFRAPALAPLGSRLSDSRKLAVVHSLLRRYFPRVARVAVALYDPKTGKARTFLSHGDRPTPLARYEARVADASSLRRVFLGRRIRVVNDMDIFAKGRHLHTRALRAAGFKSGAAFPIIVQGRVTGFVFQLATKGRLPAPDLPCFSRSWPERVTSGVRSAGLLLAA
jgi:hypothetical protein